MNLEKFKELRVVLNDKANPIHQGKTYSVLYAKLNSLGRPILFVDAPDKVLTVAMYQVDYVKVFENWIIQYYDKLNKTILNYPYYEDHNPNLEKIGTWDIFRKEYNILSLVD